MKFFIEFIVVATIYGLFRRHGPRLVWVCGKLPVGDGGDSVYLQSIELNSVGSFFYVFRKTETFQRKKVIPPQEERHSRTV